MVRINSKSLQTADIIENHSEIESCPCDEEDKEEISSQPSGFSSTLSRIANWEPIVVYRKNKRKFRVGSFRCKIHPLRLVEKSGRASSFVRARANIPLRYPRYLRDLSNTVVNARWRWVILTLVFAIAGLWLLFAWLWHLIANAHGDLEQLEQGFAHRNDTCTEGIEGFTGFLLMSIETQTTIGYGSRYPTENCFEGVFLLCLQMIIAIGVEGAVLGMFYAKMTRPKIKDCRNNFSKIAVVCQRDGHLCLMFRLSDHDRSHIVGTQLRAWLTETNRTQSSSDKDVELLETLQKPLLLEPIGLLLWPLIAVHRIDCSSPLYDVSAKDLLLKKFEIIVTVIGTSDSTGQLTQSRTSYLSSEIHWGHRFRPCVYYDEDRHGYVVHRELLNAIEPVDTPLCSAHRLDEVLNDFKGNLDVDDTVTSGIGTMTQCSSPTEGTRRVDELLETCF